MLAVSVLSAASVATPLWTYNVSSPLTPISLGVSIAHSVVILGARDCPDNNVNALMHLDLKSGVKRSSPAQTISQIALAPDGPYPGGNLAGIGWRKAAATMEAVGPGGYSARLRAEPPFGLAAAITSDGALSALLFEPEPDEAHLNNRSAVLSLVNASGAECHRLLVEGQGAYDPWSVAVAPSRGPQGYTVAAIMGVSSVVLDFDVQTGAAHTLWSTRIAPGAYSEVGVAVGRAGASFAITHNAEADGASVDVYGRREGAMRLLARLTPPKPALSPQALAMAMDVDVLVVAWTDQTGKPLPRRSLGAPSALPRRSLATFASTFALARTLAHIRIGVVETSVDARALHTDRIAAHSGATYTGSQMAITLHTVDTNAGTVQRVWQHERTCPAGGSFDLVVPNALAVSRKVRAQRLTAPLHVLRPQRHSMCSAHSATSCAPPTAPPHVLRARTLPVP